MFSNQGLQVPLGPDHIEAHVTELETEIKEYKIDLKTIEKDVKNKHFEVNLTDCSNLTSLKGLQNEMGWTAAILAKSCPEATVTKLLFGNGAFPNGKF